MGLKKSLPSSKLRIPSETEGEPCYEVIKREDLIAAFEAALVGAVSRILERINALIEVETATAPQGLWTWDFTSRWDYDKWW